MSDLIPKIDEAHYTAGQTFFASGKRVRDVLETLSAEGPKSSEAQQMSFCLGFVDALLVRLRGLG